jgi:hypothetical protein
VGRGPSFGQMLDPTPETLWPRWTETIGATAAPGVRVRSCCCQCGAVQRVDLAALIARHDSARSLINALDRCTLVGCIASIHYLTQRSLDRRWMLMVRDPGILATIRPAETSAS